MRNANTTVRCSSATASKLTSAQRKRMRELMVDEGMTRVEALADVQHWGLAEAP